MLPPLNALRAFEATARHMSFKKAAAELNVTPAALSHQVKALEEHLGVPLFRRLHRRIETTENGRLLYPDMRQAFELLAQGVSRIRPETSGAALNIGVGPAFAAKWLVPKLWRFMEAHPDIEVRIAALLGMSVLGPGGVDISLRFGTEVPPGTYAERLLDETLVPLCSPGLRDSLGLRAAPDIARAPLVHDDSTASVPGWSDWMRVAGTPIDAARGVRFNHADLAIDTAESGAGVVLARKTLAWSAMTTGRLVQPFGPVLEVEPCFRFICPKGTEERLEIATFRQWIRKEADAFASLSAVPPTV